MLKNNNSSKILSSKAKTSVNKNITEKIQEKAESKTKKIAKKAAEVQNYAGAAQGAGNMFMNKTLQPNMPTVTGDTFWSKQPTSGIHNIAGIIENQILGINRVVRLEIIIEGKTISHFKHFKLSQSVVKHHEFYLMLAHDTLGNPENHNLEEAQNFLGKRITVVFKYKDVIDGPERNFVGVITEVGFSQEKGSLGNIVLTGSSPTVLLDTAPHIQSFGGAQPISLNSIADQVIREGLEQNKFDFRVDAQHGNISYSSQYEETHYNYLARMAEAYGEQFYYDGEVLHFGKLPPQEKPVKLTYGSSVNDIKVKMRAQHVNPTFYGYNSSKNEKLIAGNSKINHTSDIAKRAYEISEKTFTTPSLRIAPIKASTFMDVDASQKGTAGSKASEVFVTSGTTTVPFLYPGCIADMEMRKTGSSETSYFTKLMITEVMHEVDARGYYTGTFEAIAADTGYIPRPQFYSPKAEAQFAKVISNTDPLSQGRVQVQFDWQNGQTITEFVRVMTPDGGSSDKVNKNRGFMAIPEVGDQVVVNFVHQHPDRPFVMGGMFHGGIGGGGGTGNNIKSLSSKSGHIIELNDGGGITMKDRSGNHVILSGDGDITTTVSNNAKEKIGADHTMDIGSSLTVNVGGENAVLKMNKDGNVNVTCKTEIKLETGSSSITLKKDGTIDIKGKKITIDGSDSVKITSKDVDINGNGAKANFNSKTTITGSSVDIN
ncbi:type VI secretion system Vgr family protein [Chryseobacterium sp. CT-SW4]|uniref:type VI secretion system Vgr family protein n=1 Tax=Chryseobacterium sp. SW-1 TaxID=3157343 RepID=UPI003B01840B